MAGLEDGQGLGLEGPEISGFESLETLPSGIAETHALSGRLEPTALQSEPGQEVQQPGGAAYAA